MKTENGKSNLLAIEDFTNMVDEDRYFRQSLENLKDSVNYITDQAIPRVEARLDGANSRLIELNDNLKKVMDMVLQLIERDDEEKSQND